MNHPEPTAIFIELDPDPKSSRIGPEARYGTVSYRKRPPDSTCQHPLADFGKPEKRDGHTVVSCCCLGCGLTWQMCRVFELPKGAGK